MIKGDRLSITIPKDEYLSGVETCKHKLHVKIIWLKGATPLTVLTLRSELSTLWKYLSKWGRGGRGFLWVKIL